MDINEIAEDIIKQGNNQLATAFTMVIGGLLLQNDIQPIINKTCEEYSEDDDLNKYIIRKEYKATFDIDTYEHDKKVINEVIDAFVDKCKEMSGNYEDTFSEYLCDGLNMAARIAESMRK